MDRDTTSFIIASIILIAGGGFSLFLRYPPEVFMAEIKLKTIPMSKEGWIAREISVSSAEQQMLDVKQYILREYSDNSGFKVWLFVGYFTSQKYGTGMHSPRNCLPGEGWEIVNRAYVPLPGNSDLIVNRMDIGRGESRQTMYYWFVTRAGHLNNEFSLKGDLVKNAILGRPTDAAFIRINFPAADFDPETTEKRIGEFMRIFQKEVYSALPF